MNKTLNLLRAAPLLVFLAFSPRAFSAESTVTFDNQSGMPALVRLVGPTTRSVAVENGKKETVSAVAGRYHMVARYGSAGKYAYTKGDEFEVKESATTASTITITLHKVVDGNYGAREMTEKEFDGEGWHRTAVIEDTGGVKTECSSFSFSSGELKNDERFRERQSGFVFRTKDFYVAIPVERLLSLAPAKDGFTVKYRWLNTDRALSGTTDTADIYGKGDFGEFKIPLTKLKLLTFTEAPADLLQETLAAIKKASGQFEATLLLTNGTKFFAGDLWRYDTYYYRAPAPAGFINLDSGSRHRHARDLKFLRGDSKATISFEELRRIEFGLDETVTVTLHNGKSTTAKLPPSGEEHDGDRVSGFTGVANDGPFFISSGLVRSVEFTSRDQSK